MSSELLTNHDVIDRIKTFVMCGHDDSDRLNMLFDDKWLELKPIIDFAYTHDQPEIFLELVNYEEEHHPRKR